MKTAKLLGFVTGLALLCAGAATASTEPAAKDKPYPKKTCIVSDNELGSMGAVITKSYKGQQVKFCCKPCVKKFDKNPEKYLKKL